MLERIPESATWRWIARLLLKLHRLAIETRHRVNVSESFDPRHYASHSGDVSLSGIEAVDHYLYFGARERRNPHPLFDTEYYLRRYPDVSKSGIDPFVHYLAHGWKEGRDPHPMFCGRYYLLQVPSLLQGSISPISHYVRIGWSLHLSPHPLFDGDEYLEAAPAVRGACDNPLLHYLLHGMVERRRIYPSLSNPLDYKDSCRDFEEFVASALPLAPTELEKAERASAYPGPSCLVRGAGFLDAVRPSQKRVSTPAFDPKPIDVIVPCYLGVDETVRCLESLLGSGLMQPMEVVVIDDASPEPRLSEFLQRLAVENRITLIRHDTNRGFVSSANEGMALHPSRDVILLNSDTIVPSGWIDRLAQAAHSIPQAATLTPLSNNATICSYPGFCRNNPMPPGQDVESLDRLTADVNRGRIVEIPTAVGCCMFIRRTSLDEIGCFDAVAFGRGYGEENDFCMRASRAGWSHWLALDVFVFHAGSVSFLGEAPPLQVKAIQTIRERYPDYDSIVARHVETNPAAAYRFALTAAIFRSSGGPVILLVTDVPGPEIEPHFVDPLPARGQEHQTLTLRPAGPNHVSLTVPGHAEVILFRCGERGDQGLIDLLRIFRVSRVQVQHGMGHTLDLHALFSKLAVPVDSTTRDYNRAPRLVNLTSTIDTYRQEPDDAG